jgi:hypothetical protein
MLFITTLMLLVPLADEWSLSNKRGTPLLPVAAVGVGPLLPELTLVDVQTSGAAIRSRGGRGRMFAASRARRADKLSGARVTDAQSRYAVLVDDGRVQLHDVLVARGGGLGQLPVTSARDVSAVAVCVLVVDAADRVVHQVDDGALNY